MKIVVVNHVTLDGVMQGPGFPEEDTRDGFTQGGWAAAGSDQVVMKAWGAELGSSGGYLFGRRTYEGVLGHWNETGGQFRDALNNARKYVASNTLSEPLKWPNSTLLNGDIPDAVAKLKETEGNDLHIMGSGELIRSLGAVGLIDKYVLSIHPRVLGGGRRLFADGFAPSSFELVGSTTSTTGVIIATYVPAGPPSQG
jgi:dihydrofolate reductase